MSSCAAIAATVAWALCSFFVWGALTRHVRRWWLALPLALLAGPSLVFILACGWLYDAGRSSTGGTPRGRA